MKKKQESKTSPKTHQKNKGVEPNAKHSAAERSKGKSNKRMPGEENGISYNE